MVDNYEKAKGAEQPLLALIGTLKASGAPVNTPEMIERETARANGRSQAALTAALKTVKAAGYVFVRAKNEKKRRPKTKRVGPTFVAEFADGTVTRMSVFTSPDKLDWERGERLSIAAYQSRWRTHAARDHIGTVRARRQGAGDALAQPTVSRSHRHPAKRSPSDAKYDFSRL